MATRLFYVVYVGEPILQIALDVIRFLANPMEKGLAHITVRGPYSEATKPEALPIHIQGTTIKVTGVFDFFDAGSNTVYLGCECEALRQIWDKGDYGYLPHITLYDGPSASFARQLRDLLSKRPVTFKFRATRLSPINSRAPLYPDSLRRAMKTGVIPWLLGERLTLQDIDLMSDDRRLDLIQTVWNDHVVSQFANPTRRDGERDTLFDIDKYLSHPPSNSVSDLHSVAVRAYLSSHERSSIDRVLADPDLNLRFLKECWRMGARASQYQLNRALLTARKNGEIGKVPNVDSYCLPRAELDRYMFASEIALRLVQDEEWFSRQNYVSLDRVLCEPALSFRFDQLARSIAPGFEVSAYRWAAITIRKGLMRKSDVPARKTPEFTKMGYLSSFRRDRVSASPGMYWLRQGDTDIFIGQADNLFDEMDRVLSLNWNDIPISYESGVPLGNDLSIRTALLPDTSSSYRDSVKGVLIRQICPTMNVLRGRRVS